VKHIILPMILSIFFSKSVSANNVFNLFKKPSPTLYKTIMEFEPNSCGAGTCAVELKDLKCDWVGKHQLKSPKCNYIDGKNILQNISGQRAKNLIRDLRRVSKTQIHCEQSDSCEFLDPQHVLCKGPNEKGSSDVNCTVNGLRTKLKSSIPKKNFIGGRPDGHGSR